MRKIFLTFGDGSENFILARKRIVREAMTTRQFDEICECDWSSIVDERVLNSPLRHYKRGCGYWLWKPAIIYSTLLTLDDGDVLVYCDAGDILSPSARQWKLFFAKLQSVDLICKRISACNLHRCRKELLEKFGVSCGIGGRLCYQYEMNAVIMKRTSFVLSLIKEWLDFMLVHPDLVRDILGPAEFAEQLPTFLENRHDQSVFSLLAYRKFANPKTRGKIKTIWEFHAGWWLFGEPCISTARIRCGDRPEMGYRAKFVRVLYRVLWRVQLFLERKGVCLFWEKGGCYGA